MRARTDRSRRRGPGARRGFTLIEAIVIIVILGVIATLIVPRFMKHIVGSKQAVAESNAASLAVQMKAYILEHGMPESGSTIDVLWERPNSVPAEEWQPYVDKEADLYDPWGNKFVLRIPGQLNIDFDIVSYGKDGQPGGEGEDKDIIKP